MPKRTRQRTERQLAPLLLRYIGRAQASPATAGVPCAVCGANNRIVSSEPEAESGQLRLLCEECAIEVFRTHEGFESRTAAASARQRSLDTPFLFAALALEERARARGFSSPVRLSPKERDTIVRAAFSAYRTALPHTERREIEQLPQQRDVEQRLCDLLRFVPDVSGEKQGIAVPFSRDSFERLLKLAHLGNKMVNGPFKERVKEYDDLETYLFSLAREVGLGRFAEMVDGTVIPSQEFSTLPDVKRFRREYDEEVFWDELTRRLADRDLRAERGASSVARLADRKYDDAIANFEAPYEEEFDTYGVKRLVIDETLDDEKDADS